MKDTTKEYFAPISITLLLLAISFILHVKSCGSPMSSSNDFWQGRFELHRNLYPFSIRYLTTYSAILVQRLTSLSIRDSFFAIQFGLAIIIGPVFYNYLRHIKFSRIWSNIGVVILFTSYPIMAAHFEPVHTWDDFWTYLLLIFTFLMIIKNRLGIGALFYTLACFSRDQAILFYPAYILSLFILGEDKKRGIRLLYSILPILIFGSFIALVWENPVAKRFELIKFNFENPLRTRDTLFSAYISFGFLWFTAIFAVLQLAFKKKDNLIRLIFWGALLTLPVNSIVTFFFTNARETRIFFPPFVFVIPISLLVLQPVYNYIRQSISRLKQLLFLVLIFALMIGGIYLAWIIFPNFEYRQCPDYCREWAGINFGIIVTLILIYFFSPKMRLNLEENSAGHINVPGHPLAGNGAK